MEPHRRRRVRRAACGHELAGLAGPGRRIPSCVQRTASGCSLYPGGGSGRAPAVCVLCGGECRLRGATVRINYRARFRRVPCGGNGSRGAHCAVRSTAAAAIRRSGARPPMSLICHCRSEAERRLVLAGRQRVASWCRGGAAVVPVVVTSISVGG